MDILFGFLICFSPVLLVIYRLYIHDKVKEKKLSRKWKSEWGEKQFIKYNSVLKGHIDYYNHLSENGKKRFVKRVYNFINDISFYGKNGIEITEEIKVLIAASAVQLTFGYKSYLFDKFRYIFVYPRAFYSNIYNSYLKGGAYPVGALAFSYEDFISGYADPNDKINLGLHEMAHTLLLQLSDDKFESYIDNWYTISRKEFLNIQSGNSVMFRSYAGTNRYEFLSVAIECFFEAPKEFEEKLPNVFKHLKILLNQDPLNIEDNYRIKLPYKNRGMNFVYLLRQFKVFRE